MAASFSGWGTTWGAAWDRITDPGAMYGTAALRITASAAISTAEPPAPAPDGHAGAAARPLGVPLRIVQYIPLRRLRKRRQQDVLFLG